MNSGYLLNILHSLKIRRGVRDLVVYKIFIKVDIDMYHDRLVYLVSNTIDYHKINDDYVYGLYAWTSDKRIKKSFEEIRDTRKFKIKKYDLNEYEFEELSEKNSNQQLKWRDFITYNNGEKNIINICTTTDEYVACTYENDGLTNMNGLPVIKYDMKIPYKIFNDKLIKSLDLFGFIDDYIMAEGTVNEQLDLDYQRSFSLTYSGNVAMKEKWLKKYFDEVRILVYLFSCTFDV